MPGSKDHSEAPEPPAHPSTPGLPGIKVHRFRQEPSEQALERLRWLVNRAQRKTGVPLAETFVRRLKEDEPPPLLAQLLTGGRGGEVRLKLYLSIVLLATKAPHDIPAVPARVWAEALDLSDPDRNGARRVGDAISWLEDHRLIESERRRGTPGKVRLLSQDGSGGTYSRPVSPRGIRAYFRLPVGLWEFGWINRLSGTATGMLVIFLDMQSGRNGPQWLAPSVAKRQYGLSPDTWAKGRRELEAYSLLKVDRISQGAIFDYKRMRNAYRIDESALGKAPASRGT